MKEKLSVKYGTEDYYFKRVLESADYAEFHPNGDFDFYGRYFNPDFIVELETLSNKLAYISLKRGRILARFFTP